MGILCLRQLEVWFEHDSGSALDLSSLVGESEMHVVWEALEAKVYDNIWKGHHVAG